jgi:hypothetical protein
MKLQNCKACDFMSVIPVGFNIDSVSGGVVQFGDSFFISPKHATKILHGSGSSNTGVRSPVFVLHGWLKVARVEDPAANLVALFL